MHEIIIGIPLGAAAAGEAHEPGATLLDLDLDLGEMLAELETWVSQPLHLKKGECETDKAWLITSQMFGVINILPAVLK